MEQTGTLPQNGNVGLDASISSLNSVDHDTSATSSANIDTQQSRWTSTTTSLTASPAASREASPARPFPRSGKTGRSSPARSRKNSFQDPSPSRLKSNISASAAQRQQLSAATTPSLPPPSTSEPILRAPVPQKPSMAVETLKDAPRWPVSPRLKSPPPVLGKPPAPQSNKKNDQEPPAISVQRATPSPQPPVPSEPSSQTASDIEGDEAYLPSGMRTPARGPSAGASTLETVEEVSQPNTPGPDLDLAIQKLSQSGVTGELGPRSDGVVNKIVKSGTNSESGSDSGSVKTSTRRSSAAVTAPLLHSRQSSSTLKFGSGKAPTAGETSSKHITVEEEEVNSIPRVALGLAAVGPGGNASLKTQPSNETIRPKKEKKKPARKAPSVTSGTASSKADIFEAKIASAVEEANSSDSDETFVYDSNPPDDRPRRYHSRTPSATSMASQVDRNGMRSIHTVMESGPTNTAVKKNMKFMNPYNSTGTESMTGDEDGRGTGGRSNVGSARGTGRHHHHASRWGRTNSSNHLSLFDNESPFPHAARSKLAGNTPRQSSNPPSPRFPPGGRNGVGNNRRQMNMVASYDLDDTTTGADDERTPLLLPGGGRGSIRSARGRRAPRHRGDLESNSYRHSPSFLNRFASCLVLTIMLLLVIMGIVGFMFATSQPLTEIKLVKIGNVLASSQELMLDITVQASNPNVVVVSIDSADLEVFAKSPHAGTDSEWWRHPSDGGHADVTGHKTKEDGDDESAPNMRLGNILQLDSPLNFEGSFFQSGLSTSTGELRLARPGNQTAGGSERWERILSDEFTLILKGVLKYNLPLSHQVRSVAISGQTTVKPNSANDPVLKPNGTDFEIGISNKSGG
ncbi:vacuolar segregation subunit 7-domain-containing protein [Xylariales sp. PMI_506]|nr:vacuolar segregation subunit 7-domain-containing protein [Xylariales sp. PMI_506]